MDIQIQYYQSPIGEMILGSWNNKLCMADWRYRKMRNKVDHRIREKLNGKFVFSDNELLRETTLQLDEYFRKERTVFNIPLKFSGTVFQESVWTELLKIPYGKSESYLSLSQKTGNVKAVRAVASANGANAISIIVPCHRITGSRGELTGYAGGIKAKRFLLRLEGVRFDHDQAILFP